MKSVTYKKLVVVVALVCSVIGIGNDGSLTSIAIPLCNYNHAPTSNSVSDGPLEIAARYHLRSRTPSFFSRSKTSTQRVSR